MSQQSIPPAAAAIVHSAIGAIHGARCVSVNVALTTDAKGLEQVGGDVSVDGWSPSLHEIQMQWIVHLEMPKGADQDPTILGRAIVFSLWAELHGQTTRAAAGLLLGHVTPMGTNGVTMPIGHLHIDRSLREILIDQGIPVHADRGKFGLRIRDLHRSVINDAGAMTTMNSDTTSAYEPQSWVRETIGEQRLCGTTVDLVTRDQTGPDGEPVRVPVATFDGVAVRIMGQALPETLALAATGRHLASVARLHPAIDHRIVETISIRSDIPGREPVIIIHLRPDLVSIADMDDD